jgi:hypothetical protein
MERAQAQIDGSLPDWSFILFWRNWSLSLRLAALGVAAAACYFGILIGSASLQSTRQPGDEALWIGASRGPLVAAYTGSNR